mgnify:CR=1 FL=1
MKYYNIYFKHINTKEVSSMQYIAFGYGKVVELLTLNIKNHLDCCLYLKFAEQVVVLWGKTGLEIASCGTRSKT